MHMGADKKNGRVSFGRAIVSSGENLRKIELDGEGSEHRPASAESLHYFAGVRSDEALCTHRHESLAEAFRCSRKVVVVDEFNQAWSLFQAHKWGLIDLTPIGTYASKKASDFDDEED